MERTNRNRDAALVLVAALAVVSHALVFAQLDGSGPGRARRLRPTSPGMAPRQQRGDTIGQPPLGDYLGIPFNDAGRLRADTTAGVDLGHAGVSVPAALGAAPVARPRRRAHPQGTGSADARRAASTTSSSCGRSTGRSSWTAGRIRRPGRRTPGPGFSTGEWVGNTLKVTTTHLKDGYLKRGGPQTSDMYTMTEFITRHDDILTIVTVVDDPIYHGRAVRAVDDLHDRPDRRRRRRRRATRRRSPRTAAPTGTGCRTSCRARTRRSTEWLKDEHVDVPECGRRAAA